MKFSGFAQDGDTYPDWPSDLDTQPADAAWWETAVGSARAFGNEFFKVISSFINPQKLLANASLKFRGVYRSIGNLPCIFEAERRLQDCSKKVS